MRTEIQIDVRTGETRIIPFTAKAEAFYDAEDARIRAAAAAKELAQTQRAAVAADPFCEELALLKTATPAQIKNYIDGQVTDLASARVMLKRMALLLAVVVREN